MGLLRNVLLLFSLSLSLSAGCSLYELEKDEEFKIVKIGNNNFMSLHSKDFKIDFLLECRHGTKIYSRVEHNKDISDKSKFLQVKTSLDIENINIYNSKQSGSIKEIQFLSKKKLLKSVLKENIITVKALDDDIDVEYTLENEIVNQPSIPLSFKCNKEYFFNEYGTQALHFENEYLTTQYILKSIYNWRIKRRDIDNEKLISWFTNCKNWINIIKNTDLDDLYASDKQVIFQASKVHKITENLLVELQQSSLQNYPISSNIMQDFTSSMDVLKTLEKNKSRHKTFNNIHDIFYIRNDRSLKDKIGYILSHTQSDYYYSLLSNTKMGSFIDDSKFKIDIIPKQISIYSLDSRKDFLVVHISRYLNLDSQDTQFVTYKLSNSFCSYLKNGINKSNQTLAQKINLVDYCLQKEFGSAYVAKNYNANIQNTYTKVFVPQTSNSQSISQEQSFAPSVEVEKKKGTCETKPDMKICTDISSDFISQHVKDGLRFPTLDDLVENFDSEEYESKTIYGPNNDYFFFNEDEGWESLKKLSEDIPVDLILIR